MDAAHDADDLFADAPSVPVAGDVAARARELSAAGLTDSEIALRLGLTVDAVRTLPDVLQPMSDVHDARVQRALYESAVGGVAWSERLDRFGDVHTLREYRAPDTKAALTWLERRQRAAWGEQARPVTLVVVQRVASEPASATHAIEHDPPPPFELDQAPASKAGGTPTSEDS